MTTLILPFLFMLSPTANEGLQDPQPRKNIVETAIAAGNFKTLATALEKADLVGALSGQGPFTVFAPTDEAFAKLPAGTLNELLEPKNKAKLVAILTYHVVDGRVDAVNAIKAGKAKTLQGETVRVSISGGKLTVNEASVVANDVQATNGIIHIVDSVLLPLAATQPKRLSRSSATLRIIDDAIEAGVPLFNRDEKGACIALYQIAAFSVLNLTRDQLAEATQRALQKSVDDAEGEGSDTRKAWALRYALDRALRDLSKQAAAPTTRVGSADGSDAASKIPLASLLEATKSVFAFDDPEASKWRSVNDDVMGGVSKGQMKIDPESGTATFAGALSRKNNGGFSTVRSESSSLDLGGYAGLIVRVKGDGRTYRIQALSGSNLWQSRIYQAEIETTKGEWREIRVPFNEMNLSVRGRRFLGKTIDGAKVRSVGFSIADKNESPFALEVDWIRAFRAGSEDLATTDS